jgi:hypothetical protein
MTELTQEQRQIIEESLNSIPEPIRTGLYGTMEGIEEQLSRGDKIIFYMKKSEMLDSTGTMQPYYLLDRMKVDE